MVVLAALTRTWRDAVLLVKPETILRWHRAGFRVFWRSKSHTTRTSVRLSSATIALIKRMALDNRLCNPPHDSAAPGSTTQVLWSSYLHKMTSLGMPESYRVA